MTTRVLALAAVAATAATSASAAGLDRSFQSISPIFNDSGTLSFSHSRVFPSVTGSDSTGANYDVGEDYSNTTLAYTHDISDTFTLGFIIDQPFGADVFYNGDPTANNLAGTAADLSSEAFTLLGKYKLNDRVSLIGGVKAQRVNRTTVNLNGLSYAGAISTSAVARVAGVDSGTLGAALQGDTTAIAALGGLGVVSALGAQVTAQIGQFQADGGYSYEQDADTEYGYVIGAAYEIPDIALRFAVTYHSEIDYTVNSTETLLGNPISGTTTFVTPESL
ncbi:MAG: outer membrane protein transport protein, partial [Pseudomonadota bacterium]